MKEKIIRKGKKLLLALWLAFGAVAPAAAGRNVYAAQTKDAYGFVTKMYQAILYRSPDAAGLKNWVNRLQTGQANGSDLAYGLFFSPEFVNRNYSDEEFVDRCFSALWNGEKNESLRYQYVRELREDRKSRESVLYRMVGSINYSLLCQSYGISMGPNNVPQSMPQDWNINVTRFVARFYNVALGRKYDANGLNYWCRKINEADNPVQAAKETGYGFMLSAEMTNKHLSNRAYVTVLYKVFLDRNPDTGGLNDWCNRLATNRVNRQTVIDGFANSVEFNRLMASYNIR